MKNAISPLRYVCEGLLDLVGHGPRSSPFGPTRHKHSRVQFAQYMRRVQPVLEPEEVRRTTRYLGTSGVLSRGDVRHAPAVGGVSPMAVPKFSFSTYTGGLAARRRERAAAHVAGIRTLFHARRIR